MTIERVGSFQVAEKKFILDQPSDEDDDEEWLHAITAMCEMLSIFGISDETVSYMEGDDEPGPYPTEISVTGPCVVAYGDPGDPIEVVYNQGKAVGAWYFTWRGAYQGFAVNRELTKSWYCASWKRDWQESPSYDSNVASWAFEERGN